MISKELIIASIQTYHSMHAPDVSVIHVERVGGLMLMIRFCQHDDTASVECDVHQEVSYSIRCSTISSRALNGGPPHARLHSEGPNIIRFGHTLHYGFEYHTIVQLTSCP
jgi:hypothetical protein